ncbi:immunity protein TriTu family protein [Streptomyces sp. NPDC001514]
MGLLRNSDPLESMQSWISGERSKWESTAITSEVEVAPSDRGTRSVSWILESADFIGQVVVWGDGQSEMDLADVATGEVRSQHRRIDDHDGLCSVLKSVRDWVVLKGSHG